MKIIKKAIHFLRGELAPFAINLREFSEKVDCFALLFGVQWVYRKHLFLKIMRIEKTVLPGSYWIAFPFFALIPRTKIIIRYLTWEKRHPVLVPEAFESALLFCCLAKEACKKIGTNRRPA